MLFLPTNTTMDIFERKIINIKQVDCYEKQEDKIKIVMFNKVYFFNKNIHS